MVQTPKPTLIFPLTPGLLISMAMRLDHSFGISMGMFEDEDLPTKQVNRLNDVIPYYRRRLQITNSATGTDAQLGEEISGQGFYQPGREDQYQGMATPEGLAEAVRLCEEYSDE
jgi:hypothetical protein